MGDDDIDNNKSTSVCNSNYNAEDRHRSESFHETFRESYHKSFGKLAFGVDVEAQLQNQGNGGGNANGDFDGAAGGEGAGGSPAQWSQPGPPPGPPTTTVDDRAEGHWHYSHRSPWLRALVLGANDGLVSISSLMLGVGAVNSDVKTMVTSGLAGLIAGAGSMAIGEFVSVFSQRDTELADIEKERQEHAKGPEAQAQELEELTQIYVSRGLNYYLAKQVAEELSRVDVLKAHVRDELGIDVDALSNPLQAAITSAMAFSIGGGFPLLAGSFIANYITRVVVVASVASVALATFGAVGAKLGGAPITKAALRVLFGGWLAMGITYGILRLLSSGLQTS
ncbi:unnamed protein product [Calypogeia fissa]